MHRDLKPDNIMIVQGRDGSDVVKVVDFGIAKAVAGDETGQKVTKTGLVVGTPEYMSPEQLSGDRLDGRSDIYSLGLVFYRMLTGTLPFQADSAQETMIKRLTDDPMPLAGARPDITFPPKLQTVLDKALARRAADRYASAAAFGRDAEAAVAGQPVPGTRVAEPVHSAATQLMDAEAAVKAARARGAPPTSVAPAHVAKKFPMVPVLGGVVGVGAIAAVAVLTLGGGKKTPPGGASADTSKVAAPAPTSTQAAGNVAPTGPKTEPSRTAQLTSRPQPGPGTPSTPAHPAATVSIVDSLQAANAAFDAEQWDAMIRLGQWAFAYSGATSAKRASGAKVAATAYVQQSKTAEALTWYHNALRYDPNNQQIKDLITQLGGTP